MTLTRHNQCSWDRLQDVLVATKPGDLLSVSGIVRKTGVAADSIRIVLEGLVRAELFVPVRRDVFRRCRAFKMPDAH